MDATDMYLHALCRCRWFSQANNAEYRLLVEFIGLVDLGLQGPHQVRQPISSW